MNNPSSKIYKFNFLHSSSVLYVVGELSCDFSYATYLFDNKDMIQN
jgi:hypothetical protein